MEARELSARAPRVDEAELSRLARVADRLLFAPAHQPYGPSPSRRRSGRGLEFLELRSLGQGDDPRSIDWRATARWGRPLVRSYQDEAFASAWICLDGSASMAAYGPDAWRLAVRLATGLAYLVLHGGHRVGLLVFSADVDRVVRPARGRAHFARLAREIGGVRPRGSGGASQLEACARFVGREEAAFVVSDFLRPDALRAGLDRLRSRGARVHALCVDADGSPTADDGGGTQRTWLRDVESGRSRAIRLDDDALSVYASRRRTLRAALSEHCRRVGIPLSRGRTEAAWREVLVAHLRALEPRRA